MSRTSETLLCYGEPYPIRRGLAMDAAPARRTLSDLLPSPRTLRTATPRRPLARDVDLNEESMDYTKVLAFLRELIDPDDLKKVADMLGVEVDTTGMDRRRGGASDSARYHEEHALQARHRAGYITEGQLVQGMRDIRARHGSHPVTQDGRALMTPLDKLEEQFPHMNRLKR